MTGKTHAIAGTLAVATFTLLNMRGITIEGYKYMPAVQLLTATAGSLMPDIDHHNSKVGRKHKIISSHLKHRGITHTLLFPVLLLVAQLAAANANLPLLPDLIMGFNIGWSCHVLADMFNKKGVPLLWPLSKGHIHIMSITTGTWQEYIFLLLWIGGCVGCWMLFK